MSKQSSNIISKQAEAPAEYRAAGASAMQILRSFMKQPGWFYREVSGYIQPAYSSMD